MANKHVVLVQADDWCALYVDGQSKLQEHRIDIRDIKEMTDNDTLLENVHYQFSDILMDYAMDKGKLPNSYEEAKNHDPELP